MALAEIFDRPLLRGYIHLLCALIAPFALVGLLLIADSPAAYAGAAIFGSGLLLLFSVSAAYHLVPWPDATRRIISRVDQSVIFISIGAFYTPFCLLALDLPWGIGLLSAAWVLCLAGVALKITWPGAPRWIGVGSYLLVGWLAVVTIGPLSASLSVASLLALLAAGILYSLGAIAYATRWPNPLPRYYGHHEVFHTLVSAASIVMYVIVAVEVLPS